MSKFRILAAGAALALCASVAHAAVTYQFIVDTSSLAGQSGYVELQEDDGAFGLQQDMTAVVSGFQMVGGALGAANPYASTDLYGLPEVIGNVSGRLPGLVTLPDTGAGLNDYLQEVTFGTSLSLKVTLSGPAVDASACKPVGNRDPHVFDLGILDSTENYALVQDPSGPDFMIGRVDVISNGQIVPSTTVGPNGVSLAAIAAVPEPASWMLMLLGVGAVGAALRRPALRRRPTAA